jgi:hypothetical protein
MLLLHHYSPRHALLFGKLQQYIRFMAQHRGTPGVS